MTAPFDERRGAPPALVAILVLAAVPVAWPGARVLLMWPGWMRYLCTNEGTGPHLLVRRLTTLALLRRGGGLWGHDYGPGPAIAGVAALAAHVGGGLLALRNPRRALWAVPAAGVAAIMLWAAPFTIIEGRPVQHRAT